MVEAIRDVLESPLNSPVTINYPDFNKSVIVATEEATATMMNLYIRLLRRRKYFGDIVKEEDIVESLIREYEKR